MLDRISARERSPQSADRRHADLWHVGGATSALRTLGGLLTKIPPDLGRREADPCETVEIGIHFAAFSSELDGAAIKELRRTIPRLRATPEMRIVIGGFAGHPGSLAVHMGVTFGRIAAIRNYLEDDGGMDPDRIGIGVRGPIWFLVERAGEGAWPSSGNEECRIGIYDRHRALLRN